MGALFLAVLGVVLAAFVRKRFFRRQNVYKYSGSRRENENDNEEEDMDDQESDSEDGHFMNISLDPESDPYTAAILEVSSPIDPPRDWDFICNRGDVATHNESNQQMKAIVGQYIHLYKRKDLSKFERKMIQQGIVQNMQESGCRFLRQDQHTGKWYVVSDEEARIKVGQQLRHQVKQLQKENNDTHHVVPAFSFV